MKAIKNFTNLSLAATIMLMTCCGCRDWGEYSLCVQNNSSSDVCFSYPTLGIILDDGFRFYPDTTIYYEEYVLILKQEIRYPGVETNSLENWFSYFPNDTISVFFFDVETIETIPWETICNEYLILQRYDLSIEDLRKLNGHITYPPTEEMRGMHMFPPFEEAIRTKQE